MQVVHVEKARFRVQSESNPKVWFLVDLIENNRQSRCDCTHYRTRIGPIHHQLEEGQISLMEVPKDWSPRCKHIEAAREFWADMWLKIIEEQDAEKFG